MGHLYILIVLYVLIYRKLVPYLINNVIKKISEICNKGCMMMSLHTQINHIKWQSNETPQLQELGFKVFW
jgi:competence protein ComGC